MLFGAVLLATGAVLDDVPFLQDALIGAGAGIMGSRLLFPLMERDGTPVPDLRRRQLEALWLIGGALFGCAAYMLVRWGYA